uniref:Uncharacterized protein n=1 Tax=Setaria digitata TaxID=48799 RepID=A0A915PEW1_9BILA
MSNNKPDNDLPPPSMRQYTSNSTKQFHSSLYPSLHFARQIHQPEKEDEILNRRLANLNISEDENQTETLEALEERAKMLGMHAERQNVPSVSDMEERMARLCDVPVEGSRYPRVALVNRNEDTVEKLMKRAGDEVMLEMKWNRCGKSKGELDVNPEEFIKIVGSDGALSNELSEELSPPHINVLGRNTIRSLKELKGTMKLAKERSMETAMLSTIANDKSVDDEIMKLMKLTRQNSMKSEKISEELSRFWENRLDCQLSSDSSHKSEHSDGNDKISDEELQKIIMEAEQMENEAKQMVRQSKKNGKKNGILSRIFRA